MALIYFLTRWFSIIVISQVFGGNIVKFLVEKGADVNYKTSDGFTPLFSAVDNGNIEVVDYLLSMEANVNDRLYDGTSVLMRSMWRFPDSIKNEIAKKLLQYGADVNCKNDEGITALMLAATFGDKEIINLLIQNGANVDAQDLHGRTALMHAIINNKTEEAVMLIDNNADTSIKDKENQTAYVYAKKYNRQKITQEMEKQNGDVPSMDKNQKIINNINKLKTLHEQLKTGFK